MKGITEVWRRPSLPALEVLWRCAAWLPLLWLAQHTFSEPLRRVSLDRSALASMSFLQPVESAAILARQWALIVPRVQPVASWFIPLALAVWAAAATVGRTAVLRRAEPSLAPAWWSMLRSNLLRALGFLLLLWGWAWGVVRVAYATVTTPASLGAEPNVVLFTAGAVGLTFAAFLVWSLGVWALDVQPLKAMAGATRLAKSAQGQLRANLIETNLVMGIVRVALFVLAMTFSASPLPFQSQETQAYINVWWVGVGLFYILSSDFFHVVRRVTYLRLLESIVVQTNALPPSAS